MFGKTPFQKTLLGTLFGAALFFSVQSAQGFFAFVPEEGADASPYLIPVVNAPGGGGPGNEGVNQYSTPLCENPPYSFCGANKSKFDQIIQSVLDNHIAALQLMTEQFSAVAMYQMGILGGLFDARHQLQAQRSFQTLTAEAVKDYHPSETMCRFGSYTRSIARDNQKATAEHTALNEILNAALSNQANSSAAQGDAGDMRARLVQYRSMFCDPADNNGAIALICEPDEDRHRPNADIDFSARVAAPLSLNVDFSTQKDVPTPEEEAVIAMARNLYWPQVLEGGTSEQYENRPHVLFQARNLAARQNIAHNTFAAQVGLKASATETDTDDGAAFMKAMLREYGLEDEDIHRHLGENPGYYAQMEVLTKKIGQHPNFYTNLYEKPMNVKRTHAALQTVQLMQMRDRFNAALRQEMLLAAMIETELSRRVSTINEMIGAQR